MKLFLARRIAALILSVVTLFALSGVNPLAPVSAAVPPTTIVNVKVISVRSQPKWYAPIFALGPKARIFFTCVIGRESRSTWTHPDTHDGDSAYPGQYGIFQFSWPSQNNAWDAYVFPRLHVEPRYASAYEQSGGAAILWRLGDEKQTWSLWDGCAVP